MNVEGDLTDNLEFMDGGTFNGTTNYIDLQGQLIGNVNVKNGNFVLGKMVIGGGEYRNNSGEINVISNWGKRSNMCYIDMENVHVNGDFVAGIQYNFPVLMNKD